MWSAVTAAQTSSQISRGNDSVSGNPPAREMMSGRSESAMRSRIADETIPEARLAKRSS